MTNKITKLKKTDIRNIVESNSFIRNRSMMNMIQFKILAVAISRISRDDTQFLKYTFNTQDIIRYCNIPGSSGSAYQRIKYAVEHLMKQEVRVQEDDKTELVFSWLSAIRYRSNTVEITLNQELAPYLLELERDFTQLNCNLVMQFRNYYSIRLFMLLFSSYCQKTSAKNKVESTTIIEKIDISQLKEILGIEPHKYASAGNLKLKVINPAIAEIQELTPYDVRYDDIKSGKAISGISFCFRYNQERGNNMGIPPRATSATSSRATKDIASINTVASPVSPLPKSNYETTDIYMAIYSAGIKRDVILQLHNTYSDADMGTALEYMHNYRKEITNKSIFFGKILEKGYCEGLQAYADKEKCLARVIRRYRKAHPTAVYTPPVEVSTPATKKELSPNELKYDDYLKSIGLDKESVIIRKIYTYDDAHNLVETVCQDYSNYIMSHTVGERVVLLAKAFGANYLVNRNKYQNVDALLACDAISFASLLSLSKK